jgi:hypothetical protein
MHGCVAALSWKEEYQVREIRYANGPTSFFRRLTGARVREGVIPQADVRRVHCGTARQQIRDAVSHLGGGGEEAVKRSKGQKLAGGKKKGRKRRKW